MKKLSILLGTLLLWHLGNAQTISQGLNYEVDCINDLIFDADGDLYIFNGGGELVKYTAEDTTAYLLDSLNTFNSYGGITIDNEGVIWIANKEGLYAFDNGNIESFKKNNSTIPEDNLRDIATDGEIIWIAVNGVGLIKKDKDSFELINPFPTYSFPVISDIEINNEGTVFASFANLIAIIRPDTIETYDFRSLFDFNNYTVNDIFLDEEENVWIATSDGLLIYRKETNTFESLLSVHGEMGFKHVAATAKGEVFAWTDDGELYYNNELNDSLFFDWTDLENPNIEGFILKEGVVHSWGYNGVTNSCYLISNLTYIFDDEDEDGFSREFDCDDSNPSINPNAEEIVNNEVDENCDGIVEIVSAIHEIEGTTIQVFPNPTSDILNVNYNSPLILKQSILSMTGQVLLEQHNSNFLDLSNLSEGIYLLQIESMQSDAKMVEKIVVKRF